MASRSLSWVSPRFGQRVGRLALNTGDGWLVAIDERTGALTWVREDLLDA
jgi:hypothetical protein